jgi:hypothetical protein
LHAVWFQLAMIVGDKATINQGAVVVHGHAGLGGAGVSVAGDQPTSACTPASSRHTGHIETHSQLLPGGYDGITD